MTDDAWEPERCELREAADSDSSGHAARNIELLQEGARDGAISREAARESIARIRDGTKTPAIDGEGDGGT